MHQENPPDAKVEDWVAALGIESLCQWDVLVFLYRHGTSLIGADYIARLLGYATDPVVAALDVLESLGFVERSRVSQGARLYQFTLPSVPPRGRALERLLDLAGHRAGRLLVSTHLPQGNPSPQDGLGAVPRLLDQARQVVRPAQQRSRQREEGRQTWLKAI